MRLPRRPITIPFWESRSTLRKARTQTRSADVSRSATSTYIACGSSSRVARMAWPRITSPTRSACGWSV